MLSDVLCRDVKHVNVFEKDIKKGHEKIFYHRLIIWRRVCVLIPLICAAGYDAVAKPSPCYLYVT